MAGKAKAKANSKVRIADNGYRFPEQLPSGEKLIDSFKNEWIIGEAICRGGFGEIYESRPHLIKSNLPPVEKNKLGYEYEYVVKVDHLVGPLFCEMNFYIRAAKYESIKKWKEEKGLKFLGVPSFIATGTHTKGEIIKNGKITKEAIKYRFLVMPRFGSDLQKVLAWQHFKLPLKTAYTIGIKILDALEYIHSYGYVHADIKASNLLLSLKHSKDLLFEEIYLVDFGLVEKYLQGADGRQHKPYGEDLRKANNGTIEFTSRDAHIGCFSRRGDIEILAYNLLSWLSGARLPWMHNLADKTLVKNLKNNYMDRLDDLLEYAFQTTKCETVTSANKRTKTAAKTTRIPDGISEFFKQLIKMKYADKPDYRLFKSILQKAIISNGEQYDGTFFLSEGDKKLAAASSSQPAKKVSPLKRKYSGSKNSKKSLSESIDCSDVSVIFDESGEEEMVILSPAKKTRKASSNGVQSTASNTRNGCKSPTVLNAKIASNGRTKNGVLNGKASSVQKSSARNAQLLNENGINKLTELVVVNNELNDEDSIDKKRRRNPSRKVKNSLANENNKLAVETPVKNGHNNKSTTVYDKSENQIVFQGKVWKNPTPAMLELLNRVKNKAK